MQRRAMTGGFVLALAFGGVGALAFDGRQGVAALPPELPVVRLDGVPGGPGVLSQVPPRPAPAPMPSLPVTHLDARARANELDAAPTLSVTFARPLPVRDVLLLLLRGTSFSVVVDPGGAGTFVGELKDVTLRQALESVLYPAGLDYAIDGTLVRVFPRRPETRFFSVDHLNTGRSGMDFFAETGAGVQTILSATGKYHVDRKAALIQVTDFTDRLDTVTAYLETVQLRVNRQVRIRAQVFEVVRADRAPIDWAALAARPRSGVGKAAITTAGWRIDDIDAWLRTVAEVGAVRQIAAPTLLAMNNEPAILRAEDAQEQVELRLTVTPQIAADRIIHLHVTPSYTDGRSALAAPGDAGARFTTSVDTVVRLADGDTMLIGGLMRRRDAATLAELVLLLTATSVTP